MENSVYPCPACGAPADLGRGCSGCGRPPYPPAAEVIRLDREITVLAGEVDRARAAYREVSGRYDAARSRRAELAARVRAEVPRQAPTRPVPVAGRPVVPVPVPVPARPVPVAPGRPETSTRTVQGVLFVLGGVLLGTAAVVFTAVAWAAVGVAGRALILAAFTVLALAVPLVAARRGLRGTAETFAAVGLLLVVLDGYAAWAVDLFGAAGWPGTRYAALVGGASAAVAAGYARLSRLTVPWFAALLVAQPVLPLAAAELRPDAGGWTLVLLGVALLDLVVVVALRRRYPAVPVVAAAVAGAPGGTAVAGVGAPATAPGARIGGTAAGGGPVAVPRVPRTVLAGRVLAWLGFGAATLLAAGCALVPLAWGRAAGQPLLAGAPLLLVALVVLGGAWASGERSLRQIAAGLLVPVLATALLRPVADLRPGLLLVAAALVAVALAGAVRALPSAARSGPRVGALVVAGGLAQVVLLGTLLVAGGAVARSQPPWRGARPGSAPDWGWQLPVAVVLTAAVFVLLLPRVARPVTVLLGVTVIGLALPAVIATPWPATVAVDLVLAVVFLATVLRPGRRTPTVLVGALAAGALAGHGLLVALATRSGTLTALGVVLLAGFAAAALSRRGTPAQHAVGGVALVAALLAVPAQAVVALVAAGAAPAWSARGGFAAAALTLVVLVAVRRHRPDLDWYASTATTAMLGVFALAPLVVTAEPSALYPAAAALLLIAVDRGTDVSMPGRVVAAVLTVVAGLAVLPATVQAVFTPYDGWVRPWSGVPSADPLPGAWTALAALLVLAVGAQVLAARADAGRATRLLTGAAFGAAVLPLALVALGAPWPVGPAAVILIGLAALLVVALTPSAPDAARPLAAPPTSPASSAVAGSATSAAAAGAPASPAPAGPAGSVTSAAGTGSPGSPVPAAAPGSPVPAASPGRPGAGLLRGLVLLPVGLLWTLAGLAGLLATRAGTLAGLALLVVAAVMVGAVGRQAEVRVLGSLVAVAAATGFAVTASLAAGLPLRTAGFAVLAVAVVVLFLAPPLARRAALAGQAMEAAAQAVALVALLFSVPALRHAAVICVLWGVAVALRVLRRGESAAGRWAFAGIAGASELLGAWLLLAAGGVVLWEAYTLPAAGLALVAGLVALRTRPGLNSWLALGPGLAAGLLPSLVSVLVAPDPQPWRRLLLGTAALGVVLAGATRRWQAPVVLGGATLTVLALHELVRGWDLLPRWIFLAVGGLTLIALAATYERRRRDLARLRAAVGRMS
ncbi:SCO7613 C-terminal domain-containing membrane protein [Micromonospora coxensis]|uniref:SCO7613 C-terminal domain-containing membrane protein n=1 Tax=Micromonospora coxensis TaxID=356852 RepID=UPI00343F7797